MPRYLDSGSLPSGGISLSPGQWYPSSQSATSSQSSLGNNTLRLYPKLWPVCTLASVLIDVATQGQSGSTFQACVYADNNGAPGALLHDFGAISTASTTPTALTGTWKIPFYGVWWFGGVIQNAPTTSPAIQGVTSIDGGTPVPLSLNTSPGAGTGPRCVLTATVSGALPATFTPAAVAGIAPRLLLKTA